jgi:Na+-transporting NADH:ubiquinone oxidoreductase subunit A
MVAHTTKAGLDLPIKGQPADLLEDGRQVGRIAIMNDDFPFMKPRMYVAVGDEVKRGQPLFEDRKAHGVVFTAPAAGRIMAINRGARRAFRSLVIQLSEDELNGGGEQVEFEHFKGLTLETVTRAQSIALLQESGLWTAIRMRPYSRIPGSDESCQAIFVTATNTHPVSGSMTPRVGDANGLAAGLKILTTLTDGKVWFCHAADVSAPAVEGVESAQFGGKHPAGLVGTHIHTLAPVSRERAAWHLDVQDVMAIGKLFTTGQLDSFRVISIGGPTANTPRHLRVRLGADIGEMIEGEVALDVESRVISGSVLGGRDIAGDAGPFLGRYHNQITCLAEDRSRVFLGWLGAGSRKFSTVRAFASRLLGSKMVDFTTTTHGSHRAMVPIGMFERVMPLDMMPTFLLRALEADDLERAEQLGCLELDEEDLALCTFVSPGKADFGQSLRRNLETIWKEG